MMFETKIYKPVDGKMVLQEVVPAQEGADRTFNREMKWKHNQLKRWREEDKRPDIKCLNCLTLFKQQFGKKYCSAKCGNIYRNEKDKAKTIKTGNQTHQD